jgi:5-methyltetrahydropteroyltriglutamate--homocysteine methyltransferase
LLRPTVLLDAFAEADAATRDANGLRQVQDQAVRDVVREQEARGLPLVTDGEFRRRNFQEGFGDVAGFSHGRQSPIVLPEFKEISPGRVGIVGGGYFPTVATRSRLSLTFNRPLEEFIFARALTDLVVNASFMTPNRIIEISDAENSTAVYPDVDSFRADVVAIQREMIAQLIRAGCKYIHIDAPGYASWVDPSFLEAMRERGENPDIRLEQAIANDNAVSMGSTMSRSRCTFVAATWRGCGDGKVDTTA